MPGLLDLFLPDRCVLCRMIVVEPAQHRCCSRCWGALPRLANACRHCALPLRSPGVCAGCVQHPLIRGIAVVPLTHTKEARYLLGRFKFHRGFREGQALTHALYEEVINTYLNQPLPAALIGVPTSFRNVVRRQHDQGQTLADQLSARLGIPALRPLRRRHGQAQKHKTRAERLKLSVSTFRVTRDIPFTHVAVVDDVLTTGSTVRAVALTLHNVGVHRVDLWCATRSA